MAWLRRHAWQLLLVLTALIAVIGVYPVMAGINEDASVPLGIAGMTAAELEADNPLSFRLIDFQARTSGLALIVIGTLLSAVLLGAFRRGQRWAWWAMWMLPLWGAAVFVVILAAGIAPGQAPPTPFITGPVIALLSSALLLVSAPRFFGGEAARHTAMQSERHAASERCTVTNHDALMVSAPRLGWLAPSTAAIDAGRLCAPGRSRDGKPAAQWETGPAYGVAVKAVRIPSL